MESRSIYKCRQYERQLGSCSSFTWTSGSGESRSQSSPATGSSQAVTSPYNMNSGPAWKLSAYDATANAYSTSDDEAIAAYIQVHV